MVVKNTLSSNDKFGREYEGGRVSLQNEILLKECNRIEKNFSSGREIMEVKSSKDS